MPKFLQYEKVFRAVFAPFLMLPEMVEKLKKYTEKIKPEDVDNSGMALPLNPTAGIIGNKYSKQSSGDKSAASAQEKLTSAVIKANDEYAKRLDILRESLRIQEDDLFNEGQKLVISSDDFSLAQQRSRIKHEDAKLESEKLRELASANAEFNAQGSKEKNQKYQVMSMFVSTMPS
jgi:hypothetical protein